MSRRPYTGGGTLRDRVGLFHKRRFGYRRNSKSAMTARWSLTTSGRVR